MKNYCKKILALILVYMMFLTIGISYAHSGRTDSNGGHKDNKNKSGLGSYHYHCGGNPAHLHNNGVCPYSSNTNTKQTITTNTKTVVNKESESKPKEINPTSIEINEDINNMEINKEIQLTTNIIPEDTTNKNVQWESSDNSIAKVDSEGNVIALKEGTVEIKAITVNGKEDTIKITIEDVEEVKEVSNSIIANNNDISNVENKKIEEETDPISSLMGATLVGGGCYLGYKKIKKNKEQ